MGSIPKEIESMEEIANTLEQLINEDSDVALQDSWFVNNQNNKRRNLFDIPLRSVLRWLQYHSQGTATEVKDKYDVLIKLAAEVRNKPKGATETISHLCNPRLLKSNISYFIEDLRHIAEMVRKELAIPTEAGRNTTPGKRERESWLWRLYGKTLKVIVDAVLERVWPK